MTFQSGSILAAGRITASAVYLAGNFADRLWKADYFCSVNMRESTEFSFPPKVEAKIQLIIKNTGYTRTEVIKGLVLAFFDKSDSPGENISAFVHMVKGALRELESGG